jgi:hypothetical protein
MKNCGMMKKILQKKIKIFYSVNTERLNQKYNFLLNLNNDNNKMMEFKRKIGTFVDLPYFGPTGSNYVPKDYINDKFLITHQRYSILEEIIENEKEGKRITGGMVLSGPHGKNIFKTKGVGKSHLNYLIASYAFVNSFPLLYIPRCSIWVTESDFDFDEPALYWLKNFYHFNHDLFDKYEVFKMFKKKFEDLAEKEWSIEYKKGSNDLQKSIMGSLSDHNETPVVKIIY